MSAGSAVTLCVERQLERQQPRLIEADVHVGNVARRLCTRRPAPMRTARASATSLTTSVDRSLAPARLVVDRAEPSRRSALTSARAPFHAGSHPNTAPQSAPMPSAKATTAIDTKDGIVAQVLPVVHGNRVRDPVGAVDGDRRPGRAGHDEQQHVLDEPLLNETCA